MILIIRDVKFKKEQVEDTEQLQVDILLDTISTGKVSTIFELETRLLIDLKVKV